jgi:formylglycine-generating enzyme required for sulfatase activity
MTVDFQIRSLELKADGLRMLHIKRATRFVFSLLGGLSLFICELSSSLAVDFKEDVQPILERYCLSCHSGKSPDGDCNLSSHKSAFESGVNAPSIVPFEPDNSLLYTMLTVAIDDSQLMPPVDAGGPLTKEQIETVRAWISEGAKWPDAVRLKPNARPLSFANSPDNLDLVRRIHALIVEQAEKETAKGFEDYTNRIPKTGIPYLMKAISGGTFLMGCPEDEQQREAKEGPQTKVTVDSFWMGMYEVTWDEYEPFMITAVEREKHGARKNYDPEQHTIVDAVSGPTTPYMEMSFGMGQSGYPAISMTQHAANKYCQWLSAQTRHFYRLPTEAEWEYACRAGTTTAYSFGDDASVLGDYAWSNDNSDEAYHKVGTKKPNPWGLYDMHGNVMEWTADQYSLDYFSEIGQSTTNPYLRPTKLYPRSVRGGGWEDSPDRLRSAYRRGSVPEWKQQDPQLPKSIWYHTDALWLGFRIVRPRKIPSPEEMYSFWNSASGMTQ